MLLNRCFPIKRIKQPLRRRSLLPQWKRPQHLRSKNGKKNENRWLLSKDKFPNHSQTANRSIIKKEQLDADFVKGTRRFQIIREDDDRCRQFGASLSSALKEARWVETTPPSSAAPGYPLPLGITIRNGTIDPASEAGNDLAISLRTIGLHPDQAEDPALRTYDYVIIYISDHGRMPQDELLPSP